jgi:hypothetical protein
MDAGGQCFARNDHQDELAQCLLIAGFHSKENDGNRHHVY